MVIHIYLNGKGINADKMILGLEEVCHAISEEREEIHTTELYAIRDAFKKNYEMIFHYDEETASLSSEKMDVHSYLNVIPNLIKFIESENSKDIASKIFGWVLDANNEYSKMLEKQKAENEKILSIKNFSDYLHFRVKSFSFWEYFLYACLLLAIIFAENSFDKIITGIASVICIVFIEFCKYDITKRRKKSLIS